MNNKRVLTACLFLLAVAGVAQAQTYLVDFSSTGGAPSAPDSEGNFWNHAANGTTNLSNLIDSSNGAGGIDLAITVTNNAGTGSGYGGGTFNNADATDTGVFADVEVFGDGLFSNDGDSRPIVLSFSDLALNTSYEITVYGGRNDANWTDGEVNVTTGTIVGGDFSVQERELTTFTIASTGTGTLAFEYQRALAGQSALNSTIVGLSITAIPEPGSYALLAGMLGLGCVMLRRRR